MSYYNRCRQELPYQCHPQPNLRNKCVVTATTGKASYNIKGITIHSLLKLPVGSRRQKDLTGETLARLQKSLNGVEYILIDEYSMLAWPSDFWLD